MSDQTADRLAATLRRLEQARVLGDAWEDVQFVLDQITTLKRYLRALDHPNAGLYLNAMGRWQCRTCGKTEQYVTFFTHAPDCVITQARRAAQ